MEPSVPWVFPKLVDQVDPLGIWVHSKHPQVKERMEVSPKQQTAMGMMSPDTCVAVEVGRLEHLSWLQA